MYSMVLKYRDETGKQHSVIMRITRYCSQTPTVRLVFDEKGILFLRLNVENIDYLDIEII